ncbi:MAG: hypothetical protein HQ507_00730, partial [Candidatus Marinimicrobia bacterium]|nr:hypothetical protein [Candidatus Neomarinimicrobiota bacterium]
MNRFMAASMFCIIILMIPVRLAVGQSHAETAFQKQDYDAALEAWNKLLDENPDLK